MNIATKPRAIAIAALPVLALAIVLLTGSSTRADEGMFTFDRIPAEAIKKAYGFQPDQAWLNKVQLGSIRLAGGCSASIVSSHGLVLSNHHCARACLDELSSATQDMNEIGFYAKTEADEKRCPSYEADQLVAITDVTDQVAKATKGLFGEAYAKGEKAAESEIEKSCDTGADIRCDVVSLYDGGVYNLYKYKRYQDVRLVWVPEEAIAFFGGDPDNFTFPRYDLDGSLLRIYVDGKPMATDNYFPFSNVPAKEGDLAFVSGNPGGTSRQMTAAQLRFDRDVVLPWRIALFSEMRGLLTELRTKDPELARVAQAPLFGIENSLKAFKGMHKALTTGSLITDRENQEAALTVPGDNAETRAEAARATKSIADAVAQYRGTYIRAAILERSRSLASSLVSRNLVLLRYGVETQKPDAERLAEYRGASLPAVKQRILVIEPVNDELTATQIGFWLNRVREELGADDPAIRTILGKEAPYELAKQLVATTTLKTAEARKALLDGGSAAIAASNDPLLVFLRRVEPLMREARLASENGYEAVVKENAAVLTKARFAVYGTSIPPDATFSPRLSYGKVASFVSDGKTIQPITNFGGAFDRATGHFPFKLPDSWVNAEASIDKTQPLNFVTTNDIIGGNSGSPILNSKAELIGLIFDGNIDSLGGDYGYDGAVNRAVGVSAVGLRYALATIYHADRIARELQGAK